MLFIREKMLRPRWPGREESGCNRHRRDVGEDRDKDREQGKGQGRETRDKDKGLGGDKVGAMNKDLCWYSVAIQYCIYERGDRVF